MARVTHGALLAGGALFAQFSVPAYAQTREFDIPALAAGDAINLLGRQAGIQIIAARAFTQGKRSRAVRGAMTVQEALSRILKGTGLRAWQSAPQTYVIIIAATDQTALPGTGGGMGRTQTDARPTHRSTDDEKVSEADIVVTGIRASLQSAQSSKRFGEQIVDAIVSEDIGKLPDRNVGEALQRIPGVQIQRQYGEGSSVAIRGLTQIRTELNGRDIFTASGVNRLSLEDIPSELLASVSVYKNPSADLIEDQLGGTINFRTRKPFDFEGFKAAGAITNSYFELSRKSRPSGSGLVSGRWDTSIGQVGILASLSYQRTAFRQDRISTEPFFTLDQSVDGVGNPNNLADYGAAAALGRLGEVTTLPHGAGVGKVYGDRRRLGTDLAIQWKPSDRLELTAEMFRNDYKFRFYDDIFFASSGDAAITPMPGVPFSFAPDGDFKSGTFVDVPLANYTSYGARHSRTTDYSLNARWQVTDSFNATADLQHVAATTASVRAIVGLSGGATALYEAFTSKATPTIRISAPKGLTDPSIYNAGFFLDNLVWTQASDSVGRLDAQYDSGGGLVSSIRAGLRYADRRNRTDDTGYRYTGLSTVPDLAVVDQSDFFYGKGDLFGDFLAFPLTTIVDYDRTLARLGLAKPPAYLPSGVSTARLRSYAGYLVAFFSSHGALPVDGNIGVRFVQTRQLASGFHQLTSLMDDPTRPDAPQITGSTSFAPVGAAQSYGSLLPSLNIRARMSDALIARLAVSKNVARPSFSQINPSLTLMQPGREQEDEMHTAMGGNPHLRPMTATNIDASLEWYFSRNGSLSVAGFYKHISNYIQTQITNQNVTFANGQTFLFSITTYDNVANAQVKGLELAYQQFFDFLPGPLAGFGVQANLTYVDSRAPGPGISGPPIKVPLELLSKYNYNLVGMYERGPLSVRIAYNWRSRYVESTAAPGSGNLPLFDEPFGQLDASLSYTVTPHFTLTLDGVNLTNAMRSTYFGISTRPRESLYVDRRISASARISF
ncbi:TonB-dependent receptor [Sphingobium sp. H39-3-25]|uniref:TonB-dependent receptor n=1 Tax=Sphingobium arseniciresistens TaxID=3030834 RepID=UPI0023B8BFE3|nr:TonB-dependent receptor [Sphingobium arseniciresistens]